MKKIEMASKAMLAIVAIITLFPAGLLTLDLYGAYIAHLPYSPWLHWHKDLWTLTLLHVLLLICWRALLYSFDRCLKINTNVSIAEMVFLPLLLGLGVGFLVLDADVYFSTIGHFKYSTLFHLYTKGEIAQASSVLCPVFSLIPLLILFIHVDMRRIIVLEKRNKLPKSIAHRTPKDFSNN
jgi:hypothetical protein